MWEDAEAPPIRRASVQVEGQVMELCWLAADSRHLVGSWVGSQVVDPQEVSRLRRQEQPNTLVKPHPLSSRPSRALVPEVPEPSRTLVPHQLDQSVHA